jgi:hypothetical protein
MEKETFPTKTKKITDKFIPSNSIVHSIGSNNLEIIHKNFT